jgi:hypothetical protein
MRRGVDRAISYLRAPAVALLLLGAASACRSAGSTERSVISPTQDNSAGVAGVLSQRESFWRMQDGAYFNRPDCFVLSLDLHIDEIARGEGASSRRDLPTDPIQREAIMQLRSIVDAQLTGAVSRLDSGQRREQRARIIAGTYLAMAATEGDYGGQLPPGNPMGDELRSQAICHSVRAGSILSPHAALFFQTNLDVGKDLKTRP